MFLFNSERNSFAQSNNNWTAKLRLRTFEALSPAPSFDLKTNCTRIERFRDFYRRGHCAYKSRSRSRSSDIVVAFKMFSTDSSSYAKSKHVGSAWWSLSPGFWYRKHFQYQFVLLFRFPTIYTIFLFEPLQFIQMIDRHKSACTIRRVSYTSFTIHRVSNF